jgi:FkbM family methyltransferase
MLIPFKELFKKYDIKPAGILHLGGNTGQEADAYEELGIKKVVWVEAIPSVFEELKKNVAKYPNHLCINACVSNINDQEVTFNISNNDAQSSSFLDLGYHTTAHPEVHYIEQIKMKTKRVDSFITFWRQSGDWLLNADLQGAELLAFKGLGEVMKHIKWIYTEINSKETYKGCSLVGEVDEYLGKFGFKRVETAPFVGNCWSDALYIR